MRLFHINPDAAWLHGLSPEARLACAVLCQLLADVRSRQDAIRQEAMTFLANRRNIEFWCDLLGLSTDRLWRYVQRLVAQPPRPPRMTRDSAQRPSAR